MTLIPVVNEQDEIIGYKDKKDRSGICRITSAFIFNSKGEFLIAQRQFSKPIDPGVWGPSVAGTVEEGETYDSNVVKEVEEEIGVTDIELTFFKKFYYEAYNGKRFNSVYIGHIDKPAEDFKIQEDEVAAVRWISIPELTQWYERAPQDFVPSFQNVLDRIKEYENQSKKT